MIWNGKMNWNQIKIPTLNSSSFDNFFNESVLKNKQDSVLKYDSSWIKKENLWEWWIFLKFNTHITVATSKLHNSPNNKKKRNKKQNKKCFSCQNLNEDAQLEISTESKKKVLQYDITTTTAAAAEITHREKERKKLKSGT